MAHAAGDDQELVRRLARGDQAAFKVCYERYQGPIFRFAWHMSGNHTTAEEVTQEVFLRLIHKPKKFDATKGSLGGYLFGIARNVMRRQMSASRDWMCRWRMKGSATIRRSVASRTCYRNSIGRSG